MVMHVAMSQDYSSLLPGTQCDFNSVPMICDLNMELPGHMKNDNPGKFIWIMD